MITPAYARTMAAYNAEMNRRVYAAAGRLPDAARREPRGAFWGSIHGTLNHLLWADRMWMSRLALWPKPSVRLKRSGAMIAEFAELQAGREATDAAMIAWAGQMGEAWLAADQTWFSSAAQRTFSQPRALLITHMFNHQTHHRGQVHAMLTAAGEQTGDTDLLLVLS
jgi:uncharacterized damage-inducible protein DinB